MARKMFEIELIKDWWRRSPTKRDRKIAGIAGLLAGFWISVISLLVIEIKVPFLFCIGLVVLTSVLFALIGRRFPKVSIILFYPFAMIGIGGSN